MGDGTKDKPYTRKDVLRRIKKHGGTAIGLDLSRKWFRRDPSLDKPSPSEIILLGIHPDGINLSSVHLEGVILDRAHLEGADLYGINLKWASLWYTHLEDAFLTGAHLEQASLSDVHLEKATLRKSYLEGSFLGKAHLEGADLSGANLKGANLSGAHLERAYLHEAELSHTTKLEGVDWGDYVLGEEKGETFVESFGEAADTYRNLKMWHTQHGFYDIAGKFFYREMETRRKAQMWREKPHLKLWYWAMRMLCGYGERPERVVISAAAIVFGLAIAYFLWGSFSSSSFADTLYYSVASFTALGYGNWAPQPTGWAKGVGAAEAVLGVSMMALFLVTFTRKMIR